MINRTVEWGADEFTFEQLESVLGKIVELRFFGSLNVEDTASVLGISAATVKRDWMSARAWLQREIGNDGKR